MNAESLRQFHDWGKTLQRGHERVVRFLKDPVHRLDPASEQGPRRLPVNVQSASTLAGLPACLMQISAPLDDTDAGPAARQRGPRRSSFLCFPPEVRNMIYKCCVDYPDCRALFDSYYVQRTRRQFTHQAENAKGKQSLALMVQPHPAATVQLRTPTIFLLCKQITREALSILRTRAFIIDRIPPWVMGNPHPLPITDFISRRTLQSVRFLEVRISLGDGSGSGLVWLKMLTELLRSLREHALVKVRVVFKIKGMRNWLIWPSELYYYERILHKAGPSLAGFPVVLIS